MGEGNRPTPPSRFPKPVPNGEFKQLLKARWIEVLKAENSFEALLQKFLRRVFRKGEAGKRGRRGRLFPRQLCEEQKRRKKTEIREMLGRREMK